ncbi:MAG TPA: hypothetical protein VGK65_03835, partial [Candidatus Binatia bacterium]
PISPFVSRIARDERFLREFLFIYHEEREGHEERRSNTCRGDRPVALHPKAQRKKYNKDRGGLADESKKAGREALLTPHP